MHRVIAMAACVFAAFGAARAQNVSTHPLAGPPAGEGAYRLNAGPYRVGVVDEYVLKDPDRQKVLKVRVRYPRAVMGGMGEIAGSCPLVLFSHGLGGSSDAFEDLSAYWASHGYVVVHPVHADSVKLRREQGTPGDRPRSVQDAMDKAYRGMDLEAREGRVMDLVLVLDSLDVMEREIEGLRGEDGRGVIDRAKIAAAGHSAGAYTTQLITGMKIRTREHPAGVSYADRRVKAGVVISGQGINRLGITETAWTEVAVPVLAITGSRDIANVGSETPATRRHPFEFSRGTAKGGPAAYLLFIEGASHGSYAGRERKSVGDKEGATEDPRMIGDAVKSTTLAFLDWHLKGEQAAGAWLKGGGAKEMSSGRATLSAK